MRTYKDFVEKYGERPPDIVFAIQEKKIEEAVKQERRIKVLEVALGATLEVLEYWGWNDKVSQMAIAALKEGG